jgi:hypothetical protein
MTPEEKSLLERTYKLAEENNGILRGIRRTNRISALMRGVYWIVIIGLSVGAYYAIQPYVSFLTSELGQLQGGLGALNNATSAAQSFKDLLK